MRLAISSHTQVTLPSCDSYASSLPLIRHNISVSRNGSTIVVTLTLSGLCILDSTDLAIGMETAEALPELFIIIIVYRPTRVVV